MDSMAQGDGTVPSALGSVQDPVPKKPTCCSYYHKPIFILVISGLLFSAGFAFFFHSYGELLLNGESNATTPDVKNDGFEVGPLCLSVGLTFVVVGVVLLSITKRKVKRMERKNRARARMG